MNKGDFRVVLWDIDGNEVGALPPDFVIQRVLSYGVLSLIIESIKEKGLDAVRAVFLKMKPSAIPKKKYNYLKNYLLV